MTTWHRSSIDGGVVLRAGESWIRIRPRVETLRGVRALVDAVLASLDAPAAIVHEPQRALVTDEGELAAVGGARCIAGGHALECTVAIVGAALCIEALGAPAVARDHALTLLRELGLGLGGARRRWFRYDPPADWFGIRRPHSTAWLHPAHPRLPAIAQIFDARPLRAGDAERLDQFLLLSMSDDFIAHTDSTVAELRTAHGLEGRLRTIEGTRAGRALIRIAAACADDRFAYLAHFEGVNEPTVVDTIRRLFDSFRPLPHAPPRPDALALWEA